MIPKTPLNRYILVVVGESPNDKAAMINPTFDEKERVTDLIGSFTVLSGQPNLELPDLISVVGEIADCLKGFDYSLESPVASAYIGDIPVSYQILPEGYNVSQVDETDDPADAPAGTSEGSESLVDLAKADFEKDVAFLIKVGDKASGMGMSFEDFLLLITNPQALSDLMSGLTAHFSGGVLEGSFDFTAFPDDDDGEDDQDLDEDDQDDEVPATAAYIVSCNSEDAADLVADILDFGPGVVVSRVG